MGEPNTCGRDITAAENKKRRRINELRSELETELSDWESRIQKRRGAIEDHFARFEEVWWCYTVQGCCC